MGSVCRAAAAAAAMAAEGRADSLECLVCKRGDRGSLPREGSTLAIVVPLVELATEVTTRLDPSFTDGAEGRADGVSPARLELLLLPIPAANPLWLPFPPVWVGLEPKNSDTCKWKHSKIMNLGGWCESSATSTHKKRRNYFLKENELATFIHFATHLP